MINGTYNVSNNSDTCILQSGYVHQVVSTLLGGLKPVRPRAVISYGPTGSGKSSVLYSYLSLLPENDRPDATNFTPILIDTLVDMIQDFQHFNPCDNNNGSSSNVSKEMKALCSLALQQKYHTCRKEVDDISTLLFRTAIQNRYNILYETTGNNVSWLMGDLHTLRASGYEIILVYPIVPLKTLLQRLDVREKQEKRIVNRAFVNTNYVNALNHLHQVLPHVDHLYLFDNTENRSKNETMPLLVHIDNVKQQKNCNKTWIAQQQQKWDIPIIQTISALCKN